MYVFALEGDGRRIFRLSVCSCVCLQCEILVNQTGSDLLASDDSQKNFFVIARGVALQ